jgi:hypothetical protein
MALLATQALLGVSINSFLRVIDMSYLFLWFHIVYARCNNLLLRSPLIGIENSTKRVNVKIRNAIDFAPDMAISNVSMKETKWTNRHSTAIKLATYHDCASPDNARSRALGNTGRTYTK